jgi:hypothetical protein
MFSYSSSFLCRPQDRFSSVGQLFRSWFARCVDCTYRAKHRDSSRMRQSRLDQTAPKAMYAASWPFRSQLFAPGAMIFYALWLWRKFAFFGVDQASKLQLGFWEFAFS